MIATAAVCLAMNVYFESRSEPLGGRAMVVYVTLNRAGWQPKNVCDVVLAPSQFSWTIGKVQRTRFGWGLDESLRPTDAQAWREALDLAEAALSQPRPKHLAAWQQVTHFHAASVRPSWRTEFTPVLHVGNHFFYRSALS